SVLAFFSANNYYYENILNNINKLKIMLGCWKLDFFKGILTFLFISNVLIYPLENIEIYLLLCKIHK
ncbi:MAG: hypothetical protein QME06_00855, partial [Desulfobacterales bacterium]|nr:hypothetical protein [Desulfobacterales bacterium]